MFEGLIATLAAAAKRLQQAGGLAGKAAVQGQRPDEATCELLAEQVTVVSVLLETVEGVVHYLTGNEE